MPTLFLSNKATMKRVFFRKLLIGFSLIAGLGLSLHARAEDEAPEALVKRLSVDVLDSIKSDKSIRAGDLPKVIALVDAKVLPNMNFQRMTSSVVGPAWRQASPEQQKRLQEEFKVFLVHTYAGALGQVKDQVIAMKPSRINPEDKEVIVRSEIKGGVDPIHLDYRLEKTPGQGAGWKIYDISVADVWLLASFKSQFSPTIKTEGLDGLVAWLVERNKANAKKS
jgi:phospholipid transport system substrate-binding protein